MSGRHWTVMAVAVAATLAACGPGATPKFEKAGYTPGGAHGGEAHGADVSSKPPEREAFAGCAWGQVEGIGLRLWSQTCPNNRLVVDEARGALVIESTVDGVVQRGDAIRLLTLREGGLPALAADLLAQGNAPSGAQCALTTAPNIVPLPAGVKRYVLEPTGPAKAAWDKANASDTAPDTPPCGIYGVAVLGDRYIEIQDGHPDHAFFVELGSEVQIFEPNSIGFAHAHADDAHGETKGGGH